jgi:hypothetical protein
MEDGAGMRFKRDHGRNGANRPGSFDHRLDDELMAKMQTIEHSQR